MKKLMVICAAIAVLFVLPACSNLIEKTQDPGPAPGPIIVDGKTAVVLFKNGTIYNFDYTANYDGIQLNNFATPKGDPKTQKLTIEGSPWTSTSSKVKGGGAPPYNWSSTEKKNLGGEFKEPRGENVMEFMHANDKLEDHSFRDEAWIFTLFGSVSNKPGTVTPLVGSGWSMISLWVKVADYPDTGTDGLIPSVTVQAASSNGWSYGSGTGTVPMESVIKQEWVKLEIPLEGRNAAMPADDWVRTWQITVPAKAGLLYIDEVIIYQ